MSSFSSEGKIEPEQASNSNRPLPPSPPPSSTESDGHPQIQFDNDLDTDIATDSSARNRPHTIENDTRLCDIARHITSFREQGSGPHQVPLSPYRLCDLEDHLRRHHVGTYAWWVDSARYEYSHDTGLLSLCMPSAIHESFTASLTGEIERQLARIAEHNSALERFVKGIRRGGSPHIEFKEDGILIAKKIPDGCFNHKYRSRLPSLVIEVAKTQSEKSLSKECYNYIATSKALIKCVIGCDLEPARTAYKKGDRSANISLWRGRRDLAEKRYDIDPVLEKCNFRAADGQAVDGELLLTLADLTNDSIFAKHYPGVDPQLLSTTPITLTFAQLSGFLDEAESQAEAEKEVDLKGPKRLASSSPEYFSEEREAKVARQEEEEERRQEEEAGPLYGNAANDTKQLSEEQASRSMRRRSKSQRTATHRPQAG